MKKILTAVLLVVLIAMANIAMAMEMKTQTIKPVDQEKIIKIALYNKETKELKCLEKQIKEIYENTKLEKEEILVTKPDDENVFKISPLNVRVKKVKLSKEAAQELKEFFETEKYLTWMPIEKASGKVGGDYWIGVLGGVLF